VPTVTRSPRMQGRPPITFGSCVMRARRSMERERYHDGEFTPSAPHVSAAWCDRQQAPHLLQTKLGAPSYVSHCDIAIRFARRYIAIANKTNHAQINNAF